MPRATTAGHRPRALPPLPDHAVPALPLLGRSWVTRGWEYRARRLGVAAAALLIAWVVLRLGSRALLALADAIGPDARLVAVPGGIVAVAVAVVAGVRRRRRYWDQPPRHHTRGPRTEVGATLGVGPSGGAVGLLVTAIRPVALVVTLLNAVSPFLTTDERDVHEAAGRLDPDLLEPDPPPRPRVLPSERPVVWPPPERPVPTVPFVGRTWARRGVRYWMRRALTLAGFLLIEAILTFVSVALVQGFVEDAGPVGRRVVVTVVVLGSVAAFLVGLRWRRTYWASEAVSAEELRANRRRGAAGGAGGLGLLALPLAPFLAGFMLAVVLNTVSRHVTNQERDAAEELAEWDRRYGHLQPYR